MIFTDHINGNVLHVLTYHAIGFSDAKEIFFFLSGLSCCLMYGKLVSADGYLWAQFRACYRTGQIYIGYLIVVVAAFVSTLSTHELYTEADEFVLNDPSGALLAAVGLRFLPQLADILPPYMLLVGAAPLLILALRRWPTLVLTASLLVWAACQIVPSFNLPDVGPSGVWSLNPFSWQLTFCLGLSAGAVFYHGGATFRSSRSLRALCWFIIIANLAFALAAHAAPLMTQGVAHPVVDLVNRYWLDVRSQPREHVLRLTHFLAVAYLVASHIAADAKVLRSCWCRPFILCGQSSLQIFCLGAILSMLGSAYVTTVSPGIAQEVLLNLLGWGIMLGSARCLAALQRGRAADAPALHKVVSPPPSGSGRFPSSGAVGDFEIAVMVERVKAMLNRRGTVEIDQETN